LTEKQFKEYDFAQIVFIAEMLFKKNQKREKQLFRAAAMIVWHLGGAPKKTFDDFLNSIGLSEDRSFTKNDKQAAIEKSNEVIKRFEKIWEKNKK
jgi:hypothetical protein